MSFRIWCLGIAMVAAMAGRAAALPTIELLTNGNFETGTFAGWTVTDLTGSNGTWAIATPGALTPISSIATALNLTGGNFYAVSDQTGPGTHVLSQPFSIPNGAISVALTYQMFVNDSDGGPIINPLGLDHTAGSNQHARVDILYAGAAPFSTVGLDIAANYYMGVDPQVTNPNPYTQYAFDITNVVAPGGSYVLRFGEVDNQLFLNQGVDNVSIVATLVPEPSSSALLGCMAAFFAAMSRKRMSFGKN